MSDSQPPPPPPSEPIPGVSSGAGLYLAGIVILGALTAGLLYWRLRERPQEIAPTPAATSVAATTKAAPVEPGVFNAPPPPPPPPLEALKSPQGGAGPGTAGAKTNPSATPSAVVSAAAVTAAQPGAPGPCSACGEGQTSGALNAAIQNAASGARTCYNRALKTSEVSGTITVSVQVGSTGAVCGASITRDNVGSGEIATCVLDKFRGKSFPAPQSGCVVLNIPIRFEIKQ